MPNNSESHNDLPRQTDALRVTHDLCAVTDEKYHSRTVSAETAVYRLFRF